ncbi:MULTISPECIES: co-chaperone HscB [Shewanella]|uniref:Co-chaperone protein HscB homolog n=1 Tax=Shewanella marisflavi TaxID=260364 RepID=A0AAC9TYZ7_9GAMM|nr:MULTISPECIES: co-chaperone HscB [Shewanella]ASJ96493.1 co-chaperone HscB [Shewanella marisflavi]MCL1041457.1 co-chaperone HscB [Shewanella marisflavi]QDF75023.1 co-chaperone HscB [Shewanella marisflavi]
MNYFELFSLSPEFDLDTAILSERYRELQRAVHPDKFANASEQDKRLAVQRTAQVNDGYNTLKHPISRAEHMLSLKGIDLSHESTTVKDTGFLMQQMEWREALEEIADSDDPDEVIEHLHQSFSEYRSAITAQLAQFIESSDQPILEQAADLVRKLKFMAKLQAELERAEDALF